MHLERHGGPPGPPQGTGLRLGRYTLDGVVHRGHRATLLRVRHQLDGSIWACKAMHVALRDENARLQLLHEAWLHSQVRHPNVVRTVDLAFDDDFPCPVLEWVDGITLVERVRRVGPLPVPEAVALFRGLAWAVHTTHQSRVLHGSITPGNLLYQETVVGPRLLLTDFGCATCPDRLPESCMGPGLAGYAAPERHIAPSRIDECTDVYSLATVLYWMLAGRGPHDHRANALDRRRGAASGKPYPLIRLRPELPVALCGTIRRAMRPLPEHRTPTALQLLHEVEHSVR